MLYCTGESPFEVKVEAASNDITEHPHDDKPRPYLCTVCDKRFTTEAVLNRHRQVHAAGTCETRFVNERKFALRHEHGRRS